MVPQRSPSFKASVHELLKITISNKEIMYYLRGGGRFSAEQKRLKEQLKRDKDLDGLVK